MKTGAACCVLALGVASASSSDWDDFKAKFGKTYASAEQEAQRRGIFESTLQYIEETNAKKLGFELGVNQFSDLLVDEFAAQYFGMGKPAAPFKGAKYLGRHVAAPNQTLPSSVDWVSKGAVTPVKNQGQCGSCWAFSTTGSLEGANFLSSGKLVSLSEQQFVDCAGSFGNQGCNGGLMDDAFKYAEQAAICTEDSYPYQAKDGKCQASSCTTGLPDHDVTGYKDVSTDSKEDLMSAVAQQPVSIAIEADLPIFQSYKSGVLSGMCGAQLDHGVLVVGYGTDADGGDYWKVKNSWGESWGDDGYVLLKRGKGGSGECGILTQPSYPVLGKKVSVAEQDFEDFKKKFGKKYESEEQEAHRFGIFQANVQYIVEMNAKKLGFTLAVNQFADLLVDEWSSKYFGMAKPSSPFGGATYLGRHVAAPNQTLPSSVDWVSKGAVTPVKNQGQCGSCWAFSTTGSLEGANFLSSGKLVSFSEQQFVDCAGSFGNQGCNGGLMDDAFKYAEQAAICTEDSYPYQGTDGSCRASSCTDGLAKAAVAGYKDVATDSKEDLMSAVAQQPVSIAIEADKPTFQFYHGGVLTGMCGAQLDHGVLVVGYGTDGGKDYWKVKNSWGETYGEEGYVRLLRGKGGAGECGILSQPSYPQVKAEATTIVV